MRLEIIWFCLCRSRVCLERDARRTLFEWATNIAGSLSVSGVSFTLCMSPIYLLVACVFAPAKFRWMVYGCRERSFAAFGSPAVEREIIHGVHENMFHLETLVRVQPEGWLFMSKFCWRCERQPSI